MKILIENGTIVNENKRFQGAIVVENDCISEIIEGKEISTPRNIYDKIVDATGCFVIPGVIDCHVHFREPGLISKADIASESRAAAYGGVTSFFEMPNTSPQTTTLEALNDKLALAKTKSYVNYSFFFGATNTNVDLFSQLDIHRIPGIKLFMGSSTGNMLVDKRACLERIFAEAPTLIMTHCEDTNTINANMKAAKERYGDDPPISLHPTIRSREACVASTSLAVELAKKSGARLHVAHITTADELQFFGVEPNITGEAVIPHLLFSEEDYAVLGARIKCNPAIKKSSDRLALRNALSNGVITTVGTDHAPHLLSEKQGQSAKSMSGMPMVQYSLQCMLELVDQRVLTLERLVMLMCHQPATLFEVSKRGFIREGYKADITIVKPHEAMTVNKENIQSKCKWSPLEGKTLHWSVKTTMCNGHLVWHNGVFNEDVRGEEIRFRE